MVGRFAPSEGVEVFRVCGDRKELETIVKEVIDAGGTFLHEPIISHVHRGQFTVKLELKVPVGVGSSHGESNTT